MNHAALNQYKSVGVQSGLTDASPHQLITMLLDGALDRVACARGAIERSEVARKGELLGSAIAIIDSMRASLDYDKGGEISVNLGRLYDYVERRLVEANATANTAVLDEASSLLREIKAGWVAIPADMRRAR
ncbi:MAG: flagellar export chaperone FliS [Halioglobus sp.]|nr:flagellar export chaperone FliS [Halioglobus sp.]